ncbi:4318879a-a86e-45e8-bf15-0d9cf79606fc [Sclerotinia trifoliorum]|uniref:4318879a-a86e-45e8-bf15-0d9cf79606fc n=1 Tax=Sclerotinia trifoliorum TaxID=28548 RepID=A0A8H2ZSK7_9HELO|nr:4318879a-a86e-45e8-bf15-0d9cf79606fc [Sclerotinia trifoliorum]
MSTAFVITEYHQPTVSNQDIINAAVLDTTLVTEHSNKTVGRCTSLVKRLPLYYNFELLYLGILQTEAPFFGPYSGTTPLDSIPSPIQLHGKYGPVVRTAENEVSFTNEQAWTSLYAPRKDAAKSPFWYAPRQNNSSYEASKDIPLDIVPWFEYMAFDIKSNGLFTQAVVPRVLGLELFWQFIVSKVSRQKRAAYNNSLNDFTHERLNSGAHRGRKYSDVMAYFSLARADGRGLTVTETENAIEVL